MVAQYSWNYGDCEDNYDRFSFVFHSEFTVLLNEEAVKRLLVLVSGQGRENGG